MAECKANTDSDLHGVQDEFLREAPEASSINKNDLLNHQESIVAEIIACYSTKARAKIRRIAKDENIR